MKEHERKAIEEAEKIVRKEYMKDVWFYLRLCGVVIAALIFMIVALHIH